MMHDVDDDADDDFDIRCMMLALDLYDFIW
jgi:hypothetical protein